MDKREKQAQGLPADTYDRGRMGENAALHFLKSRGLTLVTRNYHSRHGEIDLIMKGERQLVFVEVKARSSFAYGQPRDWVTGQKQRRIVYTARAFLHDPAFYPAPEEQGQEWCSAHAAHPWSAWNFRFDIVEVDLKSKKIRHVFNAFSPDMGQGGAL